MAQVSLYLRSIAWGNQGSSGYAYWCPGCKSAHVVITTRGSNDPGPCWTFNGDVNKPTFGPSVKHFWPARTVNGVVTPERVFCHYFIVDGEIRFCPDCEHELKGQTIPLPELPPRSEYNYGDEP